MWENDDRIFGETIPLSLSFWTSATILVSSVDYLSLTKPVRVRINHADVSLYVPVVLQESYVGLHLTPSQAKALSQQVDCFFC